MRKCWKCKQEKEITEFYKDNHRKDGYQSTCKTCNKEISKKTIPNRRQRNREFLLDFYKNNPCVDCGEKDPIVLELDHKADKKYGVSDMATNSYSLEKIQEEINKCEVRCANCHRRKTAKNLNWYKALVSK